MAESAHEAPSAEAQQAAPPGRQPGPVGPGPANGLGFAADVLRLQRAAGNRAVAGSLRRRMLARQPTQTQPAAGSRLENLFRTLTWASYTGNVPPRTRFLSGTHMRTVRRNAGAPIGNAWFENVGGSFRLRDNVTFTIELMADSWENTGSLGSTESQLLLEHEQGHYDLHALVSRDCFIAVMGMKSQTFPSALAGAQALVALIGRYDQLSTSIDNLYDSVGETNHQAWQNNAIGPPTKPPAQSRWEGYIRTAKTQERSPQVTAPDGTTYKTEIADVLRGAGLNP